MRCCSTSLRSFLGIGCFWRSGLTIADIVLVLTSVAIAPILSCACIRLARFGGVIYKVGLVS